MFNLDPDVVERPDHPPAVRVRPIGIRYWQEWANVTDGNPKSWRKIYGELAVPRKGAVPWWLNKLIALAGLALVLFLILPSSFLAKPWVLTHDTLSYSSTRGFSGGIGIDNFTDYLRLPGYPLFLALASLGDIPQPGAIKAHPCGNDPVECDKITVLANIASKTDLAIPAYPLFYTMSYRVSADLQHAAVLARIVFLLSLVALAWTLSDRLHPIAAVAVLAAVVGTMDLDEGNTLNVAATESLFPTLLFFYLASGLRALQRRSIGWVVAGSLIAIYVFLVRPAFIYVPVAHLVLTLFIAWGWRSKTLAIIATIPIVVSLAWLKVAPNFFFADASYQSASLRTAVLSNDATIGCIDDPQQKQLLTLYLASINGQTAAAANGVENYVQRYYDFASRNSYRLWLKNNHPIYKIPESASLPKDQYGRIDETLIKGMLVAAERCNRANDIRYAIYNVAMMVGLTSVINRNVPHHFFIDPAVFVGSAIGLFVIGLVALWRRDVWALFLIAAPVAIYAGTIVIVAVKQGGEARYTLAVEPLFVFAVAAALAYLVQTGMKKAGGGCPPASSVDAALG